MDAAAIKAFEERATSAEQRLAALESKLANGTSPSSSGMDVQKYVAELQALKTVLLAAQAEMIELETANSKLAYQAKILKRSLQEADEKLKKAGLA